MRAWPSGGISVSTFAPPWRAHVGGGVIIAREILRYDARMWVKLAPPPGWTVHGRTARRPDGALTLTWSRLELLPERQKEWADAVIATDLSAGARLEGVTR